MIEEKKYDKALLSIAPLRAEYPSDSKLAKLQSEATEGKKAMPQKDIFAVIEEEEDESGKFEEAAAKAELAEEESMEEEEEIDDTF